MLRLQDPRQVARGVPPGQRIERRRERVEITADPAVARWVRRIRRRPDVGSPKVRAALVRVARALNEREASAIEDLPETGQPRMKPERHFRSVGADLNHVAGWHRQRRPAAVVEGIVIRNQRAQRVVAAPEIQDDEVAGARTLGLREIAQELGRGEGDGERRDAAADELSSGDLHTN